MLRGRSEKKAVLTSIYNSLCSTIARNDSRLREATGFCERAVALSADSANAHNSLGAVLMQQGRDGAAIEAFKRALALDKNSTSAGYNLALAYSNLGQEELAVKSLLRVLDSDPNHTLARMQLQQFQRKTKKS